MNATVQTEEDTRLKRHKLRILTPGGRMETVIDDPGAAPDGSGRRGLMLIAHPHPLQGGSLENKVVHSLARLATDLGFVAVRPNFRGVGMSEGEYDRGIGEADDMLAVIEFVSGNYPDLKWCLAGFSFGGYVQYLVSRRIQTGCVLLVAPAVNLYHFDSPVPGTAMIHGDEDEVVPFAEAKAWADQHQVPLAVIKGAGHFFHGRLGELKETASTLCRW